MSVYKVTTGKVTSLNEFQAEIEDYLKIRPVDTATREKEMIDAMAKP